SQDDKIDSGDKRIIWLGQSSRSSLLGQAHPAITGFDLKFLFSFRHGRRSLNLRHTIGQDLADDIFFLADRACVEAILDRTSKCDYPNSKNRYTDQDFVESKCVFRSCPFPNSSRSHDRSIGMLECWSVENFITPFLHFSITALTVTLQHIA